MDGGEQVVVVVVVRGRWGWGGVEHSTGNPTLIMNQNPRYFNGSNRKAIYTEGNGVYLKSMWDNVMNSQFCLQPPGDTPTRSHLFVAVLAGCIPVIFDHERGGASVGDVATLAPRSEYFDGDHATSWPWRNNPHPIRLDYSAFAVVFDFNDVKRGKVDFLQVLLDMPTKDPARFQRLRLGVDRASRWMHYGLKECSSLLCDAFAVFQTTLVMLEPELQARHRRRPAKQHKHRTSLRGNSEVP